MKKVFNIYKVNQLITQLRDAGFNVTNEDVYRKKIYMKIRKQLENIENANIIYANTSNQNDFLKTFFPQKFEDVFPHFATISFLYSSTDGKLHWIVNHNGNERHFKLKTDTYLPKAHEFIDKIFKKFKKEIDSVYGYWIDYTDNGYYITDKNMKDGVYNKIAEKVNHNVKIYNKKFSDKTDYLDLKIIDK